jgi:uncharacterized protein
MALEGVVTNVTAFGAFVDVGVHQDGLVHVSELADSFVKDPREGVKAGDVVNVRVKDVDPERKRIAITMKSGAIDTGGGASRADARGGSRQEVRSAQASGGRGATPTGGGRTEQPQGESALAAALRRAREQGKG